MVFLLSISDGLQRTCRQAAAGPVRRVHTRDEHLTGADLAAREEPPS